MHVDTPSPSAAIGTDLLARLEAELRDLERRPPAPAAPAARSRADAYVLAELER